MNSDFATGLVPRFPPLAWLTRIDRRTGAVKTYHGRSVEVGDGFVVEGIWDGPFGDKGFHCTPHFFGSGVRSEDGKIWFVSSCAPVDRLIYAESTNLILVSNSLALLLAYTGARLVSAHDYREQTKTLLKGIREYDPRFPIEHEEFREFRQVVHDLLVYDQRVIARQPRKPPVEHFATYEQYTSALDRVLTAMRSNLVCNQRRTQARALGMISAGYDSTAVTVLARPFGLVSCFTARRATHNVLPLLSNRFTIDDGSRAASLLGLPVEYFRRPGRRTPSEELAMYASSSDGAQISFLTMISRIAEGKEVAAVFTGFHGDKVWDLATSGAYLGDDLRRGDVSGLDLSEVRIIAGFYNVAVPFLFAERIADLVAISRSSAMAEWRVGTGYDRPIPRRIAETAGIPRTLFGQVKRASVEFPPFPFNPSLRGEFLRHIEQVYHLSPSKLRFHHAFRRLTDRVSGALDQLGVAYRPNTSKAMPQSGREPDLTYELHVWSLKTLAGRLRDELTADQQPMDMMR